jgi:hypothetical protein
MNRNSFLKSILFALMVVLFASCDNGYNEVGANIVGGDNFNTITQSYGVVAYTQKTGPVQTSNLPVNPLGIYDNPVFGKTTYNFVTQLQLAVVNPTIGHNAAIDSVVLSIPYFSTKTGVDTDGVTGLYTLDSIYGPSTSKLKLSVYESNYFIRGYNPATQDLYRYYSDDSPFDITGNSRLNNDDALLNIQNDKFEFSPIETRVDVLNTDGTTTTTRSVPAMRLNLDPTSAFATKIIGASGGQLVSNDLFTNYVKGLYFKVENSTTTSTNMAMMNFKGGTITITYKEDLSATDQTRVEKTMVLNMTGNSVSLPQYNYSSGYNAVLSTPSNSNPTFGDEKLYLRGGQGSMAVIKLFYPGQLEQLRANRLLINDASLTFTIDHDAMLTAADEPRRVYLYDLDNKHALLDYYTDGTTSGSPKYNKFVHGGIIEKQTLDARGIRYKVKITNYLRNLVKNDKDTVHSFRLGLVVTENINDVSNVKMKNSFYIPGLIGVAAKNIFDLPTSSATNPLGTILFGSNPLPADEAKKLKFEISFTKPN